MDLRVALTQLGADPALLSDAERTQLDQEGYLFLDGLLSSGEVAGLIAAVTSLEAIEGEDAGSEFNQEAGALRLSDLVNKDPRFDICYTHPKILAAVAHVLESDFKLSSLNARAALPGSGHQALHMDYRRSAHEPLSAPDTPRGHYVVCNSLWMLTDFTPQNGATRVVPGTHRLNQAPADVLEDAAAAHPNQILVTGQAGTVVIFNSHLWHGGTTNQSEEPRRALHSYFCRRDLPQQLDQRKYLRPETRKRLSEAARTILDVD